jgi:hypothetical protein
VNFSPMSWEIIYKSKRLSALVEKSLMTICTGLCKFAVSAPSGSHVPVSRRLLGGWRMSDRLEASVFGVPHYLAITRDRKAFALG